MAVSRAQIEIAARDATAAAFASVGARFQGLEVDLDGLASKFGVLFATLGGFGLTALVSSVAEGLEALVDLSEATGASIENLSALEDVGARTGTSMSTVGAAVLKLNKVLSEAEPGSSIARQMESIGLSAEELQRVDPAEALRRVAQSLAGYADDGNKARLVQELFGKSVREVAPFLNDLAESGQLNAKVTTEQAKAAEQFNNQLSQLSKNAQDVAREITGPLVSALNELAKQYRKTVSEGDGFLTFLARQTEIGRLTGLVDVPQIDADQLVVLRERQKELQLLLTTPLFAGVKERREELAQVNADIERVLSGYLGSVAGAGRGMVTPRPVVPSVTPDATGGKTKRAEVSELERYIEKLSAAQIATLDLSAEEQARIDIVTGRLGKLSAAQEEQVLSLARGLDLLRKGADFRGPEIPADVLAARQAQAKAIDQLIASSTGARFEALTRTQQALSEQFRAGQITAEDYGRATESLGKAFEDLEPKIKAVEETSSAFAEQAARNIQDALSDSLVSAFEGNTRNIEDIWKGLIKRLVAQAAAAKLSETLFGADYGKGGSGFGGLLGSLFSSFAGSSGGGGGQFDGYRANGGPVMSGRAYMVGERGPELFVPRTSGTVLPNGATAAASQVVQINVAGDVSERNLKLIERAIANERARSMRAA